MDKSSKWKTMESAPRDGTMFLLYNGYATKWFIEMAYADERFIYTKGNSMDIRSTIYRWMPLPRIF